MLIILTALFALAACVLGFIAIKYYISTLVASKILVDHNIEPSDAEVKEAASFVVKKLIEGIRRD